MDSTPKSSKSSLTESTHKSYKVIDSQGKNTGVLAIKADCPAISKEAFPPLTAMMAHASGRKAIPDGEVNLLYIALEKNNVTVDEAMEAFWKAYADPYVSQGRIEFRHLWKYIEKSRLGESGRTFTYEEMLDKIDRDKIPMDAFSMTEETDNKGRKKWVIK